MSDEPPFDQHNKKDEPVHYMGPGPFARVAIGFGIGMAGCVAALILVNVANNGWVGAIPLLIAVAFTIFLCAKQRKAGYVSGLLLAPVFIAIALFLLLIIICGPGRR